MVKMEKATWLKWKTLRRNPLKFLPWLYLLAPHGLWLWPGSTELTTVPYNSHTCCFDFCVLFSQLKHSDRAHSSLLLGFSSTFPTFFFLYVKKEKPIQANLRVFMAFNFQAAQCWNTYTHTTDQLIEFARKKISYHLNHNMTTESSSP